jgi:hypothetical protein
MALILESYFNEWIRWYDSRWKWFITCLPNPNFISHYNLGINKHKRKCIIFHLASITQCNKIHQILEYFVLNILFVLLYLYLYHHSFFLILHFLTLEILEMLSNDLHNLVMYEKWKLIKWNFNYAFFFFRYLITKTESQYLPKHFNSGHLRWIIRTHINLVIAFHEYFRSKIPTE